MSAIKVVSWYQYQFSPPPPPHLPPSTPPPPPPSRPVRRENHSLYWSSSGISWPVICQFLLQSKRQKTLLTTRQNVMRLLDELELSPNTSFEREVVCDIDTVSLTGANMMAIKRYSDEVASATSCVLTSRNGTEPTTVDVFWCWTLCTFTLRCSFHLLTRITHNLSVIPKCHEKSKFWYNSTMDQNKLV